MYTGVHHVHEIFFGVHKIFSVHETCFDVHDFSGSAEKKTKLFLYFFNFLYEEIQHKS